MTPLRSLLVKLGLLAVVAVLAVWVGWPVEDSAIPDPSMETGPPETLAGPVQQVTKPSAPVSPRISRRAPERVSKLDLNRATSEELEQLPGIGVVLARRMIDQRETAGGFKRVEDLLTVKGIGRKRLEQLRPLLMVSPVARSAAGKPARAPGTVKDHL